MLVLVSTTVLFGCVGQEAFTKMARTGDTLSLALGGAPSHELNGIVSKSAMSVTIKDSSGVTYPVTLRYLFRLYPDPASMLTYSATYDFAPFVYTSRAYRQPNQGEWIAVIDLADPQTGVPLPLVPGPATFQVSTPDLVNSLPVLGVADSDGQLSAIKVEILGGTGSSHTFNLLGGNPGVLEPLPRLEISFNSTQVLPDFSAIGSATIIGGVGLTIDYDDAHFSGKFPPMVQGNINDPRILVHVADTSVSGNKVLNIVAMRSQRGIVVNPDPNNVQDSLTGGRKHSKISDLKIFISWDPALLQSGVIDSTNVGTVFPVSNLTVVDENGVPLVDASGAPLITPVVRLLN